MALLRQVKELGSQLERRFSQHHDDHELFPQLAYDALSKFECAPPDLGNLLVSLLDPGLPVQRLNDHFSDAPIVLYHTPKFRIEVLCWVNASTSIHQHAFSGAFRVLEGASLQSLYRFHEKQRINTFLRLGEVRCESIEWLQQGEVRKIEPGNALAHAVFHLQSPTLTLLARTHSEPWNGPQMTLLPPCVAYHPEGLAQELKPLEMLITAFQASGADGLAEELVSRVSNVSPAALAVHGGWWMNIARQHGVDQQLVHAVRIDHGELLADALPEMARRHGAVQQGHMLGRRIKSPSQRFLIALLMNATSRDAVFAILQKRYPEQNVIALLAADMAQIIASGLLAWRLQGEGIELLIAHLLRLENSKSLPAKDEVWRHGEVSLNGEFIENVYNQLSKEPLFTCLFACLV